ncbi:MAG: 2,3-bisphosphoglycerate-independent phosphoglycerate mutase [Candidatus Andersenbacteria bacterium]
MPGKKSKPPVVLAILDGWGLGDHKEHNAIALARTPFYDHLWSHYPHAVLDASEENVGLPLGQMGNSEIGHMTIGAGTVIDTDLVRIARAIKDKTLGNNPVVQELFAHVKKHDSTLHIQGLVSPGGVHSHQEHLHAFLKAAKEAGITKVAIHAFTDGRDTPPQSAATYLKELEDVIEEVGIGFIATASGRFYAMDRDNNWQRLAKVEEALFECKGKVCQLKKPSAMFAELYEQGVLDEHAEPLVFLDAEGKTYPIADNDAVFFFNFRSDRARMLSRRLLERGKEKNVCLVTMTQYDKTLECRSVFPPKEIETTLAAEIAKAGLRQAHIAETEKYAHVTYFLNGGRQEPHDGEQHILVESRKDVRTHDLAPEMQAQAIADKTVAALAEGTDFIVLNFANADMVGHTANEPAIITAVEEIDRQLKRVVAATLEHNGIVVITADHGNAEVMLDPTTGERHTAHTLNRVPAIVTDESKKLKDSGTLADIAPTILNLLELPQPSAMTGHSLII